MKKQLRRNLKWPNNLTFDNYFRKAISFPQNSKLYFMVKFVRAMFIFCNCYGSFEKKNTIENYIYLCFERFKVGIF